MRKAIGANPATAVAVSGVLIVALIVIAVGVAVWRFSAAEDSYQRVAQQAEGTLVPLGLMRQNLLERLEAAVEYRAVRNPDAISRIEALADEFAALVERSRRTGYTHPENLAALDRLERLNQEGVATGLESL